MMGQKEAVVDAVKTLLPGFIPGKHIALVMLTKDQLEDIKRNIGLRISSGQIEYSKNRFNQAEVMAYARSMVMNHLKKAKELNGGQTYTTNPTATKVKQEEKALTGINVNLLTEELKEYVKTIV